MKLLESENYPNFVLKQFQILILNTQRSNFEDNSQYITNEHVYMCVRKMLKREIFIRRYKFARISPQAKCFTKTSSLPPFCSFPLVFHRRDSNIKKSTENHVWLLKCSPVSNNGFDINHSGGSRAKWAYPITITVAHLYSWCSLISFSFCFISFLFVSHSITKRHGWIAAESKITQTTCSLSSLPFRHLTDFHIVPFDQSTFPSVKQIEWIPFVYVYI